MTQLQIAIAFPTAEPQRALLRRIAPNQAIPALYREGAEDRPCTSCRMSLNVGPRILASGVPVYCLICAQALVEQHGDGDDPQIVSLGNPESMTERERERLDLVAMLPAHDPASCVNGLRFKCPSCAAWHLKALTA